MTKLCAQIPLFIYILNILYGILHFPLRKFLLQETRKEEKVYPITVRYNEWCMYLKQPLQWNYRIRSPRSLKKKLCKNRCGLGGLKWRK
jgi:hypothetical protein